MQVPGSNLLLQALRVIQPTRGASVRKFLGESENASGKTIPVYADPVPLVNCSVQAVPFRDIQQMGLTVGKTYIKVITTTDMHSGYRGGQGDRITWNDVEFTVLEDTNWIIQDGWVRVIAVKE